MDSLPLYFNVITFTHVHVYRSMRHVCILCVCSMSVCARLHVRACVLLSVSM